MKNKTLLLLLLVSISYFSCKSPVNNQTIPILDIDTDFPVTEQLEFNPFNKYDILEEGFCLIDDSTLWLFAEGESGFGACYDLNTGAKLSIIASRGRAANELTRLDYFEIVGDSILLYEDNKTVKAFAKKDIIDNVPMGDRKFTVTTTPDSINVYRMTKLPNGSVIAAIEPSPALFGIKQEEVSEFNKKSVAIFNNKEANSYETINYKSFNIREAKGKEPSTNDLIKIAYSNGSIGTKGNDMAVFSVNGQFILYTFDIKSGKVVNEKRYTDMKRGEGGSSDTFISFDTVNDKGLAISSIKTNDKYILCSVDGYLSEEDKKSKLYKHAIFVFDWELNPVKKIDLPNKEKGYYKISNDGNSVYFCEFNEEGLALYKADLTI